MPVHEHDSGRIDGPYDVSFRPLAESDLPALMRWLADPEVVAFYGDPPATLDEARRDYVEPDTESPTRRYVIEWDEPGRGRRDGVVREAAAVGGNDRPAGTAFLCGNANRH